MCRVAESELNMGHLMAGTRLLLFHHTLEDIETYSHVILGENSAEIFFLMENKIFAFVRVETWIFCSFNLRIMLTQHKWSLNVTSQWINTLWNIHMNKSSVQFNSVTQSCRTLCNSMDCSMPGLPVHHHLLELAQIHVHWVSDAI